MKLDNLLNKIGTAHLVPDGSDEKLHTFVCQMLCVEKVSDLSFKHLNEISSSLDFIIPTHVSLVLMWVLPCLIRRIFDEYVYTPQNSRWGAFSQQLPCFR